MATEASDGMSLEALVLAAGAGRRFGGAKLTAPWAGGVLLDGALAAALAAPVRAVTVVTGADPQVEAAAHAFAGAEAPRLRVVHAPDHAAGLSASLRAGIVSLPPDCAGAFVFLGDMPRTPHAVLAPLAAAILAGAPAAAPVFRGRRGHPAVFARALFPELLALTGDQGGRSLLDRVSTVLVQAANDGVLFDVDTPEDLAR